MRSLFICITSLLLHQLVAQQHASCIYMDKLVQDSIVKTVRELSGEDSVIVNGHKTLIINRSKWIFDDKTEEYLIARLNRYNLTVVDQAYDPSNYTSRNIIGIQQGTKHPEKILIVGGHHDAVADYAADDNASSMAAVLETARILSKKKFEYTIQYIFWDEEEYGYWGSKYHAKYIKSNKENIVGVVVLEMLGYDSNNDFKFDIQTDENQASVNLANTITDVIDLCNLNLHANIVIPGTDRSDHYSYWREGIYYGVCYSGQMLSGDANPAYHTNEERINLFNLPYFTELSKLTIALTAHLAKPVVLFTDSNEKISQKEASFQITQSNNKLIISFDEPAEASILIYNTLGNKVYETANFAKQISIDLQKWNDGIYCLKLSRNQEIHSLKFLKKH